MQPDRAPPSPLSRLERLVRLSFVLLGLLLVQNVLGMALNLYIALPNRPTFAQVFLSIPALTVHIANAFLIVGFAAVGLVLIRRERLPNTTPWAVLVLVGVVAALQEGFAFTFTQDNAFSYGMEVGFLAGVLGEAMVLFRLAAHRANLRFPGALPREGGKADGPT